MNENLGKKTIATLVAIALAILAIVSPLFVGERPFRLGLDLQGGTRLVYQFNFDDALQKGLITQEEFNNKPELLQEFITIIRGRVDPTGVKELNIRAEGERRIAIELPGSAETATSEVYGKLAEPLGLDPSLTTLKLDATDPILLKSFPLSGGTIRIGDEQINYSARDTNTLSGLKRGFQNTTQGEHPAGAVVELLTNDDLQKRIENVGDMQFLIQASPTELARLGTDQATEQKKLDDWRAKNPTASLDEFNRLAPERGGPVKDLRWHVMRIRADEAEVAANLRPPIPFLIPRPKDPGVDPTSWTFTGSDVQSVAFDQDEVGYPAVRFEMTTSKKSAFADFTEAHLNQGMAIVLNGEVAMLATINSRLPGGGIIQGGRGGFTVKEVNDYVTVLRSGSLKIKPELLDKARVGASLGDDYIKTGAISMVVALGFIMVFMIAIYRRLGVFSVIGLVINLLLLLGALAFLRATLTLPGIAGVILTLGMAVDGNILIYERLREELARGMKLPQAVKAAYERAAVTIIDSNLTTLIAGVILYFVGSGPIRGFATTLNIGILSTLFTIIVVSQVLVMADVKRGTKSYTMLKVLARSNVQFMKVAKFFITISCIVVLAGVALFAWLPKSEKLGIDFLGGFSATVRTQESQTVAAVRERIGQLPGSNWKSADIKAIADSSTEPGKYTAFKVTFKLSGDEDSGGDSAGAGESSLVELRKALKDLLQRGPVEITEFNPTENDVQVAGTLYFEDRHPETDVKAALESAGLANPVVTPYAGHGNAYSFTATVNRDRLATDAEAAKGQLASEIVDKFRATKDSSQRPYELSSSIPESSFVGPQVGSELRDKAVLAVLLSLLGSVLYLRVRFLEYSYGIAVVVSLLHDVLFALGGLAVATWTGVLQAEVDLSMIAAFLTIIGFSQNDTIVIFDRVRENLPRSKKSLREVLNDSINECMGRTILTTATVLLTLLVLFAFNVGTRNVLEGFSFCLIVGVISGTYSTIYIAGPVLVWFEERAQRKNSKPPRLPESREKVVSA